MQVFTELEQKLLALALNAGAACGEIDNSAVMLLRSLRSRGVTPEDLIGGLGTGQSGPPIYSRPDYGLCSMPWGKHKGSLFKDIPPAYLLWALDWISETPDKAEKWETLATQIQGFLAQ